MAKHSTSTAQTEIPEEVREIFREIGKRGGRPIKDTTEKGEKNRKRQERHRNKIRQQEKP